MLKITDLGVESFNGTSWPLIMGVQHLIIFEGIHKV